MVCKPNLVKRFGKGLALGLVFCIRAKPFKSWGTASLCHHSFIIEFSGVICKAGPNLHQLLTTLFSFIWINANIWNLNKQKYFNVKENLNHWTQVWVQVRLCKPPLGIFHGTVANKHLTRNLLQSSSPSVRAILAVSSLE